MSKIRLPLTVAALTALWGGTHANPLDYYNVEWTTPSENQPPFSRPAV